MKPRSKYLVWLDLEMTGLEPQNDVILEIATIVTDSSFQMVALGPNVVIHHPKEVLEATMDEWNVKTHTRNGLIQRVAKSKTSLEEAEQETIDFLHQFIDPLTPPPLCGNSIQTDRSFLQVHMAALAQCFHYRNLDVSSVREWLSRLDANFVPYVKNEGHVALTDIRESIAELVYYQNTYLKM